MTRSDQVQQTSHVSSGESAAQEQNVGFRWKTFNQIQFLVPKNLPDNVLAGFTASSGGASGKQKGGLNLAFHVKDKQADLKENWARFFKALHHMDFIDSSSRKRSGDLRGSSKTARMVQIDADSHFEVSLMDQQHGSVVKEIKNPEQLKVMGKYGEDVVRQHTVSSDALFTDKDNTMLGVLTADCVPVLIYDKKGRACAAVHAGWQGTYRDITQKAVSELIKKYGLKASDLYAAIGPAIGDCCYEIDGSLAAKFVLKQNKSTVKQTQKGQRAIITEVDIEKGSDTETKKPAKTKNTKKYFLNLKEANRRQIIAAGIPKGHILESSCCTKCGDEKFFSYRRDKDCGRQLSFVMLRRS